MQSIHMLKSLVEKMELRKIKIYDGAVCTHSLVTVVTNAILYLFIYLSQSHDPYHKRCRITQVLLDCVFCLR